MALKSNNSVDSEMLTIGFFLSCRWPPGPNSLIVRINARESEAVLSISRMINDATHCGPSITTQFTCPVIPSRVLCLSLIQFAGHSTRFLHSPKNFPRQRLSPRFVSFLCISKSELHSLLPRCRDGSPFWPGENAGRNPFTHLAHFLCQCNCRSSFHSNCTNVHWTPHTMPDPD